MEWEKHKSTYNREKILAKLSGLDKVINIAQYNPEQLCQLRRAYEKGMDISLLTNSGYSAEQMGFLVRCLEQGHIIRPGLMKSEYNIQQMEQLMMADEAGVAVWELENPDFSAAQMEQLRLGLVAGLDISWYNQLERDPISMEQIRVGLLAGQNVSLYESMEYSIPARAAIMAALHEGLNIGPYLRQYNDPKMMKEAEVLEIVDGLEKGLPVYEYAQTGLDAYQMRVLKECLLCGFDVSYFAVRRIKLGQLEVIQEALEHGQPANDLLQMAYEGAEPEQMKEVLLGQYAGINAAALIHDYAKEERPLNSAKDMYLMREIMESMLPQKPYYAEKLARENVDSLLKIVYQNLSGGCSIVNYWSAIVADPAHPDEYMRISIEGYKTNNEVHMNADYYKDGNTVYPTDSVQSIGMINNGNIKRCLVEMSIEFRTKLQSLAERFGVDAPEKYKAYNLYSTRGYYSFHDWNKTFNVGRILTATRNHEQWCGYNNNTLELYPGKQCVITNYYLRDEIKVYGQKNEEDYIGIASVDEVGKALKDGTPLNKIEAVLPAAHCDHYFTYNGNRHSLKPGQEKKVQDSTLQRPKTTKRKLTM